MPGQPDFVCTGAMVGVSTLVTAPGCFDSVTEAPPTATDDWDGVFAVLAPYAVRAGDANRTVVGYAASHRYVNAAGADGGRLSVVNFTATSAAAQLLSVLPLYTAPTSVPADGLLLSFGPTYVAQTGVDAYVWAGVRTLASAPGVIDSASTASARVGACGAYRSGGTLFLDRPADAAAAVDWPVLCGNLGDLGAALLLPDPFDDDVMKARAGACQWRRGAARVCQWVGCEVAGRRRAVRRMHCSSQGLGATALPEVIKHGLSGSGFSGSGFSGEQRRHA